MKWMRSLRPAAAILLVATLIGAMLLPVYGDEIGWRFQERAGIDGVDKMFSEVCGPNTLAVPAFFMWPVRWFSAAMNTAFASPIWVRASGVLYALTLVGLLVVLVRRLASDVADRRTLTTIALGLLGLGVTPLLIVVSRPEQPILLMLCLALIIALSPSPANEAPSTPREAWLRSLAVVPLALIALSYHPKGLFVVPPMLVCIWLASRGRAAHGPRLAAGVVIVGATAMAAAYWGARLSCPADPFLARFYDAHSLNARLATVRDVPSALSALGALIANLPLTKYFVIATPAPDPMASWLPPDQVTTVQQKLWFFGIIAIWVLAQVLTVAAIVAGIVASWRARRIDRRLVLAIVLAVTTLGWASTVLSSNSYEAAFVLPLLTLTVVFALASCPMPVLAIWRERLASFAALGAIVSLIGLAAAFGPALLAASRHPGYLADQPHSVSLAGYTQVREKILATGRLCGIADPDRAHALMIDDVTYFAYVRSHLPQHQLGVVGLWKGQLRDPVGYLKSRGSDGAVLGCHLLPPGLRERAKANGPFCCLGPPGW